MKYHLQLILAAMIWGCAFVAQSAGMNYVGPWTFNCLRFFLGTLTLLAVLPFLDKVRRKKGSFDAVTIRAGVMCGAVLAAASMVQQTGIMYTTVGKAGFITALYVVIVPLLSLALGRKVKPLIWFGALLACVGLYLLSVNEESGMSPGDLIILGCAFLFSVHIMVIDRFSPGCDGVRLSCVQFLTAGILCFLPMLVFEHPQAVQMKGALLPVAYAGIMSCGAAYTLQITGQAGADPAVASILLSLESVFSVLAGWVLLQQRLSVRELCGCAVMFAAILIAQKTD